MPADPKRTDKHLPASPSFPLERRLGGHKVTIRPLQPADCGSLLRFFDSHTKETIYLRYGYDLSRIAEGRAAQLVGVDQTKDAALGVFEQDQSVPLIAIGRYSLDADGNSAELAFVVREDRRHIGIATALLEALVKIAASRGLKTLGAQVLRENQPMLEIFRKVGGKNAMIPGTASVTVTMDVASAYGLVADRRKRRSSRN